MSPEKAHHQLTFTPFQDLSERLPGLPARRPASDAARGPDLGPAPTHTPGIPLEAPAAARSEEAAATIGDDDLLLKDCLAPRFQERAQMDRQRCLAEIRELQRDKRWRDILALFHPLEEKTPALVDAGLDLELRREVAFALGQEGRFEEALTTLGPALRDHPENFLSHSAAAFNAYQSLLQNRERKVRLLPDERRERIRYAHKHFQRCQEIRPDGVTSCYREGMLYKQVEQKTFKAVRCFERAVANWESLDPDQRERRHQERPKYVRSLYHLAACHLAHGEALRALPLMERLFREDDQREFISAVHRHFAMAKILHALGRSREALDHLETAGQAATRTEPTDYVWELAARCCLTLQDPSKGLDHLNRIPERARRPYVRWTEADLLCALKRTDEAERVLTRCAERDRRSRHRALMRLARIQYQQGHTEKSLAYADAANRFCLDTYGGENHEALFWKAGCLSRLGRQTEAEETLDRLQTLNPDYPRLGRLKEQIHDACRKESPHGDEA